ncbi:hypothetical protein ACS8Y6_03505 [Salinisphaera sp. RV14]|uniref:hypothetical protein n=1 Tax=Salinisphaera sp. RV14 TaxID=3454140 RepID=UPI003F835311
MARLILILCAIGAVWLVLRRALPRRPVDDKADKRAAFTPTVRCHVCGAYLDRRLARHDSRGYCCQSHDESA